LKIIDFNTNEGIYLTSINEISTEMHSHPAIEILFTVNGSFSVHTAKSKVTNLSFAIIDSNCLHKIIGDSDHLNILIIERRDKSIKEILSNSGIELDDGFYFESKIIDEARIEKLLNDIISSSDSKGYDLRVLRAIEFIDKSEVTYIDLITSLVDETSLSESRISHLFKKDTGVSIKKYFVWSKLKKTINSLLFENIDLYTAMILNGFYDQAHFSKSYKGMIGMNPSKVYNSRILQKD
jgi:AraC-like DNA-binding protein